MLAVTIIVFMVGFGFGSFAGAQIFYPLIVTWPLFRSLKKSGDAKGVPWKMVIIPPVLGVLTLIALLMFLPTGRNKTAFFYGTIISAIVVVSQARNPQNKQETLETNKDYLT